MYFFGVFTAMDSDRHSHRIQQQSSQPPSRDRTPTPARANTVQPVTSLPAPVISLTEEEINRKANLIVDEYICNKNYEVCL